MTHNALNRLFIVLAYIVICCILPACSALQKDDFVVVTTRPGDTMESLAEKYYKSAAMAEVIAEFNKISTIEANQQIIVPFKPLYPGGIKSNRYQTIPVLVYHRIEKNNLGRMVVDIKAFKQQMQYLKKHNYQVITLDELMEFMQFKRAIPDKSVVLTFDDGWDSFYNVAYPVLKKYNFPATLFVYTDLIENSDKALNWKQIKELSDNGISIQCHTKSHGDLSILNPGEDFKDYFKRVKEEILESKKLISKVTNKQVNYLAYPYGAVNNLVAALLEENEFKAAFTVKRGSTAAIDNPLFIKRSMIFGEYSLDQFRKNLIVSRLID